MTNFNSQTACEFIANFEGFSATPYKDQGGVWTIGYGSTFIDGAAVTQCSPASISQQDALTSIGCSIDAVYKQLVSHGLQDDFLTQNQWDAVISLAYNVGVGALTTSHTWQYLVSRDFGVIEGQQTPPPTLFCQTTPSMAFEWGSKSQGFVFVDGNFDQGLFNRRTQELEHFFLSVKE